MKKFALKARGELKSARSLNFRILFGVGLGLVRCTSILAASDPISVSPIQTVAPTTIDGSYASNGAHALHYDLNFDIRPESQTVVALERMTLSRKNLSDDLTLDAAPALAITSITVDGNNAEFRQNPKNLAIRVPSASSGRSILELKIVYSVSAPRAGMFFLTGFSSGDYFFTQSEPKDARQWFVGVDRPSDKATFEVTAIVPTTWKVLSNGVLKGRGSRGTRNSWHWVMDEPMPTYLFSVLAGDYSVLTSNAEQIPFSVWVSPGNEKRAAAAFRETPAMMKYLQDRLGHYPFAKYAVGLTPIGVGGMEHASATTIGGNEIEAAPGDLDEINLVAMHELTHQWFGDLITCATWDDIWLNEGFATYFEALYVRETRGIDAFREAMETRRNDYLKAEGTENGSLGPVVNPASTSKFGIVSYQKGGLVLGLLHDRLGDRAFFQGLRVYLKKYGHKVATTRDFQRVMEETSNVNLNSFFNQWLYRPGYPELAIDVQAEANRVTVRLEQVQRSEIPAFDLPVQMDLLGPNGEVSTVNLAVREKVTTFTKTLPFTPSSVVIDPRSAMLGRRQVRLPEKFWRTLLNRRDVDSIHKREALDHLRTSLTVSDLRAIAETTGNSVSLRGAALAELATRSTVPGRYFRDFISSPVKGISLAALTAVLGMDKTRAREAESLEPELERILKDSNSVALSARAAETWVAHPTSRTYPALISVLERPGPYYLKTRLVTALTSLNDPRSVRDLAEIISREDVLLRADAAAALGTLKFPGVTEVLGRALAEESTARNASMYRYCASDSMISALKSLHSNAAKDILDSASKDPRQSPSVQRLARAAVETW